MHDYALRTEMIFCSRCGRDIFVGRFGNDAPFFANGADTERCPEIRGMYATGGYTLEELWLCPRVRKAAP